MGKYGSPQIGVFSNDNAEYDRPDLNKCPDCGVYFASDICPVCKKICPTEMRAGNRKPIKSSKRRLNRLKKEICSILVIALVFLLGGFILCTVFPELGELIGVEETFNDEAEKSSVTTKSNLVVFAPKDEEKFGNSGNEKNVHWISERQIWHDDKEERFVLVFSFLDFNRNEISASATIDIEIENDDGETVYSKKKNITKNDFFTWSYLNGAVKKYQATIYIRDEDILPGNSDSGKILFTVYNKEYFSFSESELTIFDNLPVSDINILLPSLPFAANYYGILEGTAMSSYNVTDISYEIDDGNLVIYFAGEKTYDRNGNKNSSSCFIGWKLVDSDGYVIDSGNAISPEICVGEKFRNVEEHSWQTLKPGKTYRLILLEAN